MENIKNYSQQAPHIRVKKSTQSIMLDVVIAMLPALAAAIYFFKFKALILTLVCVAACILTEFIMQKLLKKQIRVRDFSAVVTGMLLAFNLPVDFPIWMAIVGSIFAIAIVKELFGGIGQNFMNPALAARVFLLVTWPGQMGTYSIDGVTGPTPLSGTPVNFMDLFIGNIPGSIGEVSKLALLIGMLYMLYKGVIKLRMPLAYFISSAIFLYLFKYDLMDTIYQLMSGGIMLATVFMITDYSSSPMSPKGQIIYASLAGLLTAAIRVYGGYPEGVSFAIIIMNAFVPLIDRLVRPRVFGMKGVK